MTGASAAEIFDSVRQLAQARRLLPGQALPPVRELAQTLGVNRNTVAAAASMRCARWACAPRAWRWTPPACCPTPS
ncbi:GntR family transcriptional regulator, partial [Bordetella pertussis]|uniref:GntR family transcriptional regulator n=1 Tax=Bordetella pertussis TaxID=520 RepID=UPI003CC847FB